ncbi:MAG: hypothetical protein WD851_04605 [Pirellulales bacterium]
MATAQRKNFASLAIASSWNGRQQNCTREYAAYNAAVSAHLHYNSREPNTGLFLPESFVSTPNDTGSAYGFPQGNTHSVIVLPTNPYSVQYPQTPYPPYQPAQQTPQPERYSPSYPRDPGFNGQQVPLAPNWRP